MTTRPTADPSSAAGHIVEAPHGWPSDGRSVRGLLAALGVLFAAIMVAGLIGYRHSPHPANDFFAFDAFSRFIQHETPSAIYDQDRLRAFEHLPGGKLFAFMYPPGMLLLLSPLAFLPYDLGYVLWIGLGLAACTLFWAVRRAWMPAFLMVVAPSTLWTMLCGQSTLLLTAFLVGGLVVSPRRPWIGGVLLGLATYKPQLGILVPVALLATRQWRTILAATVTFATIVVVSTMLFGGDIWPQWARHLDSIVDVRTRHTAEWAMLLVTVAADLVYEGCSRPVADVVQGLCLIGSIIWVWRSFAPGPGGRKGAPTLQVAILAAATFLATPFAFIYDLPLFTAAVLLFVEERVRSRGCFEFIEILAIVAGFLVPFMFLFNWMHVAGTATILVFAAIVQRRLSATFSGGVKGSTAAPEMIAA